MSQIDERAERQPDLEADTDRRDWIATQAAIEAHNNLAAAVATDLAMFRMTGKWPMDDQSK